MSHVTIVTASLTSLIPLNQLFTTAVAEHFAYFPEHVQRRVVKEHAVHKLALAKFDPRRIILLAKAQGRIVGYAIGAAPATGPAQLFWLYVDPSYRGANTGLSLLSRMLRHLAAMGAQTVSIATHDHRAYYERQGFKYVEKAVIDGVDMDVLVFRLGAA